MRAFISAEFRCSNVLPGLLHVAMTSLELEHIHIFKSIFCMVYLSDIETGSPPVYIGHKRSDTLSIFNTYTHHGVADLGPPDPVGSDSATSNIIQPKNKMQFGGRPTTDRILFLACRFGNT